VQIFSRLSLLILMTLLSANPVAASEPELQFIDRLPDQPGWLLLDTRPDDQCRSRSIRGARCLSADDLVGPNRRLPSLRDIVWIFGTLGLQGDETMIVAGNAGPDRDFVAGLLFLAGQQRVQILRPPLGQLLASGDWPISAGHGRAMSREKIYTAAPRDNQIMLRKQLSRLISENRPLRLLDTRSEAEYWGHTIRGLRGGHIPGAELWTNDALEILVKQQSRAQVETVVYAHDPVTSVVEFARLQAHTPIPIGVLINGWRAWSTDTSLPVDSESFPDTSQQIAGVIPSLLNEKNQVISQWRYE
jgi:thiosulfate/3-mercaptopyruvate sulfurtransferase